MGAGTAGASKDRAPGSSLALCCALALAAGCASPHPAPHGKDAARVIVVGPGAARVEAAVPEALARLAARDLHLEVETRVRVAADEGAFVAASGKTEPGLRAWTTYRTVDLAPLASWADDDDDAVTTRLAHELCHAALYQAFGSEARARAAALPRFFEEGVCSVVAGQRRVLPERAARGSLPLTVEAFAGDPELAYAASTRTMELVDERLGPAGFARVLADAAADGAPGCVERALARATGRDPAALWQAVVDTAPASP